MLAGKGSKMNEAVLIRTERMSHGTRGDLFAGGKRFVVIERAWQNNQQNISCIPVGSYSVSFLERSASGRYRKCWHVQNVIGRSGILIHNGNIVRHSRGCLILGKRRGRLLGELATLNSRCALRELEQVMNRETFVLTIVNGEK